MLEEPQPAEVLFDVSEGIATITLNRPHEGNAITPVMQDALMQVWSEVVDRTDIRVAIIRGAGERHFCTGASASALRDNGEDALLRNDTNEAVNWFSPRQCKVWKPVICLVTGLAASGGLHFVVDSDIVIASESASFLDSHVSAGAEGALENIGLVSRMGLVGR